MLSQGSLVSLPSSLLLSIQCYLLSTYYVPGSGKLAGERTLSCGEQVFVERDGKSWEKSTSKVGKRQPALSESGASVQHSGVTWWPGPG